MPSSSQAAGSTRRRSARCSDRARTGRHTGSPTPPRVPPSTSVGTGRGSRYCSPASHAQRDVPPTSLSVGDDEQVAMPRDVRITTPLRGSILVAAVDLATPRADSRCQRILAARCGPRSPPHPSCALRPLVDGLLAQCRIGSTQPALRHFSPFRQCRPRASTTCTRRGARSSPGAPCSGSAVAGTAGQVPEQPSTRELSARYSAPTDRVCRRTAD